MLSSALLAVLVAANGAGIETSAGSRSVVSGEWTITWTEDVGRATRGKGRPVVLWDQAEDEGCDTSRSGRVLSVVGTLVSFEIEEGGLCEGAAHSFASHRFRVVDLARGAEPEGSAVSLYELFDRRDVQRALAADPFLRQHPEGKDWESDCGFTIQGFEYSFAFHHVHGDTVAVRVGLTHGCEVARGNLTVLGIVLKPRRDFLAQLKAAENAGTLMDRLQRRRQ